MSDSRERGAIGAGDDFEDDDFFGNQEDDLKLEMQRQEREIAAVRRYHYTTGLREGANSAREAHLQQGFDEGFSAAAKSVSKPAFLLGACNVLEAFYSKHGCTGSSNSRRTALDDTEVLTRDLRQLSEANADLRAKLHDMPLDTTICVEDAVEACGKVAIIDLPSYMQSFP